MYTYTLRKELSVEVGSEWANVEGKDLGQNDKPHILSSFYWVVTGVATRADSGWTG